MNILLVIFFFLINLLGVSKNKLIFVELQSRHGARGPLHLDENNKDIIGQEWKYPGELTGVGQRMEYILGLRNRYRYITNTYHFLKEKYDPHELLVLSTNLNRTLLSMTSQLQGFYPMIEENAEKLDQVQLNSSRPPVNCEYEDINKEINNLKELSLPNYMNIIPIHMIHPSEKRIVVYDYTDCKPIVEKLTNKTRDESEYLNNIRKYFIGNYSKNLEKYIKFPENFTYEFDDIGKICDAVIADYTQGKDLSEFIEKTTIDLDILFNECKNILGSSFRDKLYGDKNKTVLFLEESTLIKEMIYYMKLRVDADIEGISEKIDKNVSDYSRPKMVIISGHDTTLAAQILYLIKIFNLDENIYTLPTYTAQVAVEVTRQDDIKEKKYSDYNVSFYFNDVLFLNITMDNFIETVEKNTWSREDIDKFCNVENANKDNKKSKSKNNKLSLKTIILIAISILVVCLLIVIIFLVIKIFTKEDEDIESIDSDALINE